jgi:outer membrane receptor protein involved in Fe transport
MLQDNRASMRRAAAAVLLAGSAIAVCLPAHAQDVAQEEGGLADIVVTARKREETAQSVPVAVTAISQEMVEKLDLTSIEKIAARTPSLTVGRASNGSGAQITLRGIGSSSTSIGIEQSVATVVDGAYYGQGRVINEGFFDLGRVEVLKGPQALFFGKNATAGVISITTADPTQDTEIKLRAGYEFNARQAQVEGVISGPLTDTLGARLAVRVSKMWEGYFKNRSNVVNYTTFDVATGNLTNHPAQPAPTDQPGEKELLGRLTLKWEPSDQITNTLKINGSSSRNRNSSWNYVAYNCVSGFSSLNPVHPCVRDFVVRQNNFAPDIAATFPFANDDGALYNRYRSAAANNSLEYRGDKVTLSSVTNYHWNNNRFQLQGDFQSSNTPTWATENASWRSFSEEVRALTSFDGPINLMVGGLYQKTRRSFVQNILLGGVEDSRESEMRYVGWQKLSHTRGETLALFGQVTWEITPEIELAGGARYTHETKSSRFEQPYVNQLLQGVFRPAAAADGLGIVETRQKWSDLSPEVTLTWKPDEDILVYAAYKSAYKSGGFSNGGINSAFSTDPTGDLTFDKESASGFEAGIKTTLADRQLRLNLAAYSYKYKDLQIDFFNSALIAFQTLTADAKTTGAELEVEFAPRAVPGLNLHGALNYNDAHYTRFPLAPCYGGQTIAQGCSLEFSAALGGFTRQNLSGKPLSMAAKWTGQAGVSYDGSLGASLKYGIGADVRYSGSYIPSGFGQTRSRQGAYATLDASARIGAEDDRWELALIGKNLTNKFYVGGVVDGPSTGTGTGTAAGVAADQIGFVALPRTVQLQATFRF